MLCTSHLIFITSSRVWLSSPRTLCMYRRPWTMAGRRTFRRLSSRLVKISEKSLKNLWIRPYNLLFSAPEPPKIRVYRARVKRDATVFVNCSMNVIPDKASYSVNLSPPAGTMMQERTTTGFYLPASGLKLGSPYMLGIFATMNDGKRTDVRSVKFTTRK